jgi:hypothetical protein
MKKAEMDDEGCLVMPNKKRAGSPSLPALYQSLIGTTALSSINLDADELSATIAHWHDSNMSNQSRCQSAVGLPVWPP